MIVLFLLISSCSFTNPCSKNDNFKIDYYSGGGFTGIETGMTINCDGWIRYWERKLNSLRITTDSLKLTTDQLRTLDEKMEDPELFTYSNTYVGNYTTYLTLFKDDKINNISFDASGMPLNIPSSIKNLITEINKIINKR